MTEFSGNLQKIKDVLWNNENTILYFYSDWCGPCKLLFPNLKSVLEKYPNINLIKINVLKLPEISSHFKIGSIPTVIFFKKEVQIFKFLGNKDINFISKALNNFFS